MFSRGRKMVAMCTENNAESSSDSELDGPDSDGNYEPEVESSSDSSEIVPSTPLHSSRDSEAPLNNDEPSSSLQLGQRVTEQNLSDDPSHSSSGDAGREEVSCGDLPLRRRKKKWRKQIRKEKRLRGESYEGFQGKTFPARPMLRSPCESNNKHNCCKLVPETHRRKIYESFRSFENIDLQRNFISKHVTAHPKKRSTVGGPSRRAMTRSYSFTVGNETVEVCREFFLSTLNVTGAFVRSSLVKESETGVTLPDLRGRHAPHNKLSQADETRVRNFIKSFPAMESHYCRQSTTKKYLDATLNVSIMHRMFLKQCAKAGTRKVSFEKFRKIFREYNVGFYEPKKDQCKKCLVYNSASAEEKQTLEVDHKLHEQRKLAARRCRDDDKQRAKSDPTCLAINFDLEAVLNVPKGTAGQIFYLRKLAVYNFTIYDLNTQDGQCYVWNETEGKRGANEIATCLMLYIRMRTAENPAITQVRMMSDSCSGQNKNAMVAAMCVFLLKSSSLTMIRHSFFEPGHSEMECDSIHSKVERKSKNVPVYSPDGWAQIIRTARINPSPFNVTMLEFGDFNDFASMSNHLKGAIPWRKVVCMEYRKCHDGRVSIFFGLEQHGAMIEAVLKAKRGRPMTQEEPESAYSRRLPVSAAKLRDLQKMCSDLTIPRSYHSFFSSITSSTTLRDCLPAPALSEESDYDEG